MGERACIIFCNCTYADVVPAEVRRRVRRELGDSGVAFHDLADLCELAAHKDPRLTAMARSERMRIAACSPRAVKWLFHAAGAPLKEGQATVLNMRKEGPEHIIAGLLEEEHLMRAAPATQAAAYVPAGRRQPRPARRRPLSRRGAGGAAGLLDAIGEERALPQHGQWVPWFPVIDYERCANCKQCLGFCLFGVYGVDGNDRVEVQRPERCKTGCPACARVCPNTAIIFPKYAAAPVNGEAVPDDGAREHEPVQVDVSTLLGGNMQAALRSRARSRTDRPETDGPEQAAMPSGKEVLRTLRTELGVPDAVIAELGGDSPDYRRDAPTGSGETPSGECPCKRNKAPAQSVPTTERSKQEDRRSGKENG